MNLIDQNTLNAIKYLINMTIKESKRKCNQKRAVKFHNKC